MVFSGDMVLFLFINLGFILLERIIFIFRPDSSASLSKKNKKKLLNLDREKKLSLEEKNFTEEEEKENNNEENEVFFHKPSEDYPVSSNVFQISPIKLQNTQKNIPTTERLSLQKKSQKKNKTKEKFYLYPIFHKFVFHVVLLLLFSYVVFILIPTGATNQFSKRCVDENGQINCFFSTTNDFLLGFYFLYSIYFMVSSLQIR